MARIGIAEPSPEIRMLVALIAAELGREAFAVERVDDVERGCDVLVAEPVSALGLEVARHLRSLRPQARSSL